MSGTAATSPMLPTTVLTISTATIWLVATILFLLVRMIPGDTVDVMFDEQSSYAGSVDELREKLGLNDPLHVQLWRWGVQLSQGDLGQAIFSRKPVSELIAQRIEPTLLLGADMVDASRWDRGAAVGVVEDFLRREVMR